MAPTTLLLSTALLLEISYGQSFDTYAYYQYENGDLDCLDYMNCYVTCDEYRSCYGATINAQLVNILSLTCSNPLSCQQLLINAPNATNIDITCSSSYSCESMIIIANQSTSTSLTINCESSSPHSTSICDNMKIYASKAKKINFNPSYATQYIELYAEDAQYVDIQCDAQYACQNTEIYAKNAANVSITSSKNCMLIYFLSEPYHRHN